MRIGGIRRAQESIDGSSSILILTKEGIYAARDLYGRTPVIIGEKEGAFCACLETCAFPNLDYRLHRELGPGEVVLITPEGVEQKVPPNDKLRICAFLWVWLIPEF